ncbi:very short patch repair endonuclease [Nonomuraea sp. NPDC050153]|uniref:very short patch repair endonuclease n=1 Tax=Nonomuraea sp. NPDC050153 TaxID=3364359 RepID=UPI003792B596
MPASWASSPTTRRVMQSNRNRDTRPELTLRRALHALGLRYRVCTRPLPTVRRTVDVVFRPVGVCVELRGCFWHGCDEHRRLPKTNKEYWSTKIQRNRERDLELERLLAAAGWILIVVWEHDDLKEAAQKIAQVVRGRRESLGLGRSVESSADHCR